jgi:ArsR family transcriptional regulator
MKAVNFFKALSDETRLRLVHIFLHHELNVNEIVTIMGMGQSRISRHLKILTDNQLLTHRRDGLWTFYSAVTEGNGYTFIESIKYIFKTQDIFEKDLAETHRVLKQRSMEMVHFFDSIAEDWEKLKREIIGDIDLNRLIKETTPPSEVIVDLGCGTGDLLPVLMEKSSTVIGVEKSTKMLEKARLLFSENGEDINLRIGELEHLPLRDEEADCAVINMVLHHLPDPPRAFGEVHRVLKKGKTFIIIDLLRHEQEIMRKRFGDRWLGFSKEEIEAWLVENGFDLQDIKTFDLKRGLKGFIVQSTKK